MNDFKYHPIMTRLVACCLILTLLMPSNLLATSPAIPNIAAGGAILMDAKTGEVLFEKNASTRFYPASITKLMTTLLVLENLKPSDLVTFSEEAIHSIEPGSSSIGMRIGEQITVDQALHGLLLMSANEIANGLAEKVSGSITNFATLMTKRAHALGATHTQFVNPHGLHDENHYTTAYDMALIAKELITHDYFLEIMKDSIYEIPPTNKSQEVRPLSQHHDLMNPYRDSRLYRPEVTGGKTGYTNEARHTLVTTASKNNIDLIVVILQSEKPTLYEDTTKLLDFGFDSYHTVDLHGTDDVIETLPVYAIQSGQLFETATCDISVVNQQSILVPKDIKFREITTSIELPEHLELGIQSGDSVGKISYLANNKVLSSNDLIISEIDFNASPFTASEPQSTHPAFPTGFFIFLGVFILIAIIFIIILYRRHKRRFIRHKKLKFSKTLK